MKIEIYYKRKGIFGLYETEEEIDIDIIDLREYLMKAVKYMYKSQYSGAYVRLLDKERLWVISRVPNSENMFEVTYRRGIYEIDDPVIQYSLKDVWAMIKKTI